MTLRPASLDYTGDASGDFNDSAHLSAHLYDSTNGPSTPIIGAKVNITLGSQGCSNLITDIGGNVSCSIVLNQTRALTPSWLRLPATPSTPPSPRAIRSRSTVRTPS